MRRFLMFCPKNPAPSRNRKNVISARTTMATTAFPLKKYLMISSGVRPRIRSRLRLSRASPIEGWAGDTILGATGMDVQSGRGKKGTYASGQMGGKQPQVTIV